MTGGRIALVLLGALVVALGGAQAAPLAAFTVTNTDDSGAGSLRQAILNANASPGGDIITIDISPTPTGVVSITPTTALPKVTDPVSIDAAADNLDPSGLPFVRLDGSTFGSGGSPVYGLEFDIPIASTSFLSGLAFTSWLTGNTSAIRIIGTGHVTVNGILVGTDQSGASLGNYGGIEVWNGSTIGGPTADTRNVIVDSSFNGVSVLGPGAVIEGNWIGVGIDGTTLDGNGRGVQVLGSNVTIGGSSAAAGNRIQGNGVGVHVAGGTGTTIRHNSIDGSTTLGIDLGFPQDGVTPNDAGDPDTGANDLQNFPVLNPDISSATVVGGTLNSDPAGDYTIDVYDSPACDPTGNGEGTTHVASFSVVTDGAGDAPFGERPLSPAASGFLTATATDASGNTSEFSSCLDVGGGGGGGSLAGSFAETSGNVDLTTFGTQDWAIWGYEDNGTSTSLVSDESKSGGSGISDLTDIDPAPDTALRGIGQFAGPQLELDFTWTDGSPTTCATEVHGGLQHDGQPGGTGTLNDGFSFTVPADTSTRTVRVWVSAHSATGTLQASLSDDSAAPYQDSSLTGPLNGINEAAVYTLTYAAASAGQELTVEWVESVRPDPTLDFSADNVAIYAVALDDGSTGGGGCPGGVDYVVNSTNDVDDDVCNAAHCSLREAINAANGDSSDSSTITFNLVGDSQIGLLSPLPEITDSIVINGSTSPSQPVVFGQALEAGNGLVLAAGSGPSRIAGLEIHEFPGDGIVVNTSASAIDGNVIFDTRNGIVLGPSAATNTIGGRADLGAGNEIFTFTDAGVALVNAGSGNRIQGNTIGLNGALPAAGPIGISVSNTPGTVVGDNVGPGGLGTLDRERGNVVVGAEVPAGHGIALTGQAPPGPS